MSAIKNPSNASPEDIRSRLSELKEDFKELPEREQRSADQSLKAGDMIEEVGELDTWLTLHEAEQRRSEHRLAATMNVGNGVERRDIATAMMGNQEFRSWSEGGAKLTQMGDQESGRGMVIEGISQSELSYAARFPSQADPRFESRAGGPFGDFGSTGPGAGIPIGTNYDPSNAGLLLPLGQPIPPVPRQARLYLRDLMPSMNTTLAQVPYVRELSPTANEAATAVAEGGTKPSAALNFAGAKADPTVLAGTLILSKQLFEDAPAVVQYINTRLPYIVRFKEDQEFLNGSGTWPDLLGITNTPGLQSQAFATDDVTTIGMAISLVENSDGVATGVVLNPANAWNMFTHRASTSGVLDAGTPFASLPLTVWGVPSYRSRAYTAGNALVADWQRGGLVVDREGVNIQIYRETYAASNQVLIVCEERVGLAVPRPDLFVQATGLS